MNVQGERGLKREEPSELVTDSSSAVCTQHAACKAPTPCLPTYRICGPTLSTSSFSLSLTSALKILSFLSPFLLSLSSPGSSLMLRRPFLPPTVWGPFHFLSLPDLPWTTFCVVIHTICFGRGERRAFPSHVKRSVCRPSSHPVHSVTLDFNVNDELGPQNGLERAIKGGLISNSHPSGCSGMSC